MAYRSPYRGNERFSRQTRERISRATMLCVGLLLLYLAWRGYARLHAIEAASGIPALPAGMSDLGARNIGRPYLAWTVVLVAGLAGSVTAVAAVLPVAAIEWLFEAFYTPPTTGNRSAELPRRSVWRWVGWWSRWF